LDAAVPLGDNQIEDVTSPFVAALVDGVAERLNATVDGIRRDGMRVAERVAQRLGHPEITFDVLDDERASLNAATEPTVAEQTPEANSFDTNAITRDKARKVRALRSRLECLDPDADYHSDDTADGDNSGLEHQSVQSDATTLFDDDSDWSDDGSKLIPHDLDDDEEDLRETARPMYLSECLEMLQTHESDERARSQQETALTELSGLVRALPADLPDQGPLLAIHLLRLENKFGLDDFSGKVTESLAALTAEEPILVGQTLIAEFFDDCSLCTRLNVLSALNQASFELSGLEGLWIARTAKMQLG
jgi:hypothetical protein